ncbi:hypothetical protein E4T56_gene19296 [Termitomyces sp. T112]|nr:hypothetical protein C0989_002685 [Termitomyces sp. Mn162]KAG5728178.1 hypothetical protein E4T56_gene19296 [Termitomyces sp. T112]
MSFSYQSAHPSSTLSSLEECIPPDIGRCYFAFALIKGDVCLVQVSHDTPAPALTTVDVKIFRHEFITIFRLLETKTLHPSNIFIIEPINEFHILYEEENETVFLARELVGRLQILSQQPQFSAGRTSRYSRQPASNKKEKEYQRKWKSQNDVIKTSCV